MITKIYTFEDFYAFKLGPMWSYFKRQHFSFWMICCYLFFEFVRPQALIPAINFIPWAQLFLIGSLAGAILDPSVKWVSNIANKFIILFLITICISILTAQYPEIAKKHFMDFFGWFVIYFLIINIINTKERFYIFIILFLFAAGKIAFGTSRSWVFRGFSFTTWGLMGPKGYFQNSGELAILMLMLFPLAYYLYQGLKNDIKVWEKWVLMLFWICPILTILGASSRGAQIALVFELIIMFRKALVKPKLLIGIIILSMSLFYLLPAEQKERFSKTGDDKTSQQRILYWSHGWDMMKEHPWSGVGLFNFIPYYQDNFPSDMLYEHAELPHNIFIQVGTDAGFIALFIFGIINLYCLITPLRLIANNKNDVYIKAVAAGLGCGVFGFLIAGQFVTVGYYPFLWIHLAFIVALSNISKIKSEL
ncbi:MAG: O-antigen ligase family protein [Pseudomonadota bacterium]